jgi:hypothetical protein
MALDGEGNAEEPVYGSRLLKYDLTTGGCEEHHLGEGVRGGEPVFAPRSPDAAEDDGWIMTIVHDERSGKSALNIADARDFTGPPVARVHLPQRVPYGAHGNWIPDGTLRRASAGAALYRGVPIEQEYEFKGDCAGEAATCGAEFTPRRRKVRRRTPPARTARGR